MDNEEDILRKSNFLANHRLADGTMPSKIDDNVNSKQKIREAMLTELFKEIDSDFSRSITLNELSSFLESKYKVCCS
jgi:hypothetical protein